MEGRRLVAGFVRLLVLVAGLAALLTLRGAASGPVALRGLDPALLPERDSAAARLVSTHCSSCHATPDPRAHAAAEWTPVLRRMASHVSLGRGARVAPLTPTEQEAVLAYLRRHAAR